MRVQGLWARNPLFLCILLAGVAWLQRSPAAPVAGPEFGLGPPAYVAAPYAQVAPAIAFNGTNYLVVWSDDRDSQNWRVYATRVSTNGEVLDTAGLEIS